MVSFLTVLICVSASCVGALAPNSGPLLRKEQQDFRALEIEQNGQLIESRPAQEPDDTVTEEESSNGEIDEGSTDLDGSKESTPTDEEGDTDNVEDAMEANETANVTVTLPPVVLEDTALCKNVTGIRVQDTRGEHKAPVIGVWATVIWKHHGEQFDCGNNTIKLGNFTDIEGCAAAVAAAGSHCGGTFSMHKDTFDCRCVPDWSGATCEKQFEENTCLYEVSPGLAGNATDPRDNILNESAADHGGDEGEVVEGGDASLR